MMEERSKPAAMTIVTAKEQEQHQQLQNQLANTKEPVRRYWTRMSKDNSAGSQQQQQQQQQQQPPPQVPQQIRFAPVSSVSFACGLLAGAAQAGVFNPWDRALYLSIKHQRRFLSYENFARPYQGFLQSIGGRALSAGLYFPLEQLFMQLVPQQQQQPTATTSGSSSSTHHYYVAFYNFAAGTAAGAANALILNPLSAIKYKTWGREVNRGMLTEAVGMLHKGGLRPFFNGMGPTVLRDLTFGGVYTFLRLEAQPALGLAPEHQWMANVCAATVATVVSGPFNLARNIQYSTQSESVAPSITQVLTDLIRETKEKPTLRLQWRHVQERLRIGWGTARVAVGMSFGHAVYDYLHFVFTETPTNN